MKCRKLSNPEESRLGMDEVENSPFVFPTSYSTTKAKSTANITRKERNNYRVINSPNLFKVQKSLIEENKVFDVPSFKEDKIETSIKKTANEIQPHIGNPFKNTTKIHENEHSDISNLFENIDVRINSLYF